MRRLFVGLLWLTLLVPLWGQQRLSVVTDTNGALLSHTNLWRANSNSIVGIVAGLTNGLASQTWTLTQIESATNGLSGMGGNVTGSYNFSTNFSVVSTNVDLSTWVLTNLTNSTGGTGTTYTNSSGLIGVIDAGTSSIGTNTLHLVGTNEWVTGSNDLVSAWTAADAVVSNALLVTSVVRMEDFGGTADGKKLNSITNISGVITAPSGTFTAGDVGKLWLQYQDSTNLTSTLTTIATYNSSSSVTLANTSISTTNDAVFGTDNTTAMSNALASIAVSGGNIQLKEGTYLFGSASLSKGVYAPIHVPSASVETPTNKVATYTFKGAIAAPFTFIVNTNGVPFRGSILYDVSEPVAGATNALIAHSAFNTAVYGYGAERTAFRDITFRQRPSVRRHGLYWKTGGGINLQGCVFDTDIPEFWIKNTLGEPVLWPENYLANTNTTFAVHLPGLYNSGDCRIRDTSVSYYGNAFWTQEHVAFENINITCVSLGLWMQAGGVASVSGNKSYFFEVLYPFVADPYQPANGTKVYMQMGVCGIEGMNTIEAMTDVSNRLYGTLGPVFSTKVLTFTNNNGMVVFNTSEAWPTLRPNVTYGTNVVLNVLSDIYSELGANNFSKDLMVDVPFLEGSGNNVWSRSKFGRRFNPAAAGTLEWTNSGRHAVRLSASGVPTLVNDEGWLTTSTNLTVSAVVKSAASGTNWVMLQNNGVNLGFGYNGAVYARTDDAFGIRTVSTNVASGGSDGAWHIITATVTTNTLSLYWDGRPMGSVNCHASTNFPVRSFYPILGTSVASYGTDFMCNRWRIWTRAISADEVKGLAMAEGLWNTEDASGLTNIPASSISGNFSSLTTTNLTVISNAAFSSMTVTNLDALAIAGDGSGLTNIATNSLTADALSYLGPQDLSGRVAVSNGSATNLALYGTANTLYGRLYTTNNNDMLIDELGLLYNRNSNKLTDTDGSLRLWSGERFASPTGLILDSGTAVTNLSLRSALGTNALTSTNLVITVGSASTTITSNRITLAGSGATFDGGASRVLITNATFTGEVCTNNSTSTRAVAVGNLASASANDAAAFGSSAAATGLDSVALRGSAGGTGSASIGYLSKARGNYTFATMNATAGITGNPSAATDIFCFGNGSVETNTGYARFGGNGGPNMTIVSSNANFAGAITATNGVTGAYGCLTFSGGTLTNNSASVEATNIVSGWSYTNVFGSILCVTNAEGQVGFSNTLAGNYRITFGAAMLIEASDTATMRVYTNGVPISHVALNVDSSLGQQAYETGFKEVVYSLQPCFVALGVTNSATTVHLRNVCFNIKGAN